MQDQPTPDEILASVIAFLRGTVVAEARPHTAFQARVAANAIELVRRQLRLGPPGEVSETSRLRELLASDGTLEELNTGLADALAGGGLGLTSPGVADHLRATTLEKLAVDQPGYSGYRAALAASATKEA
jgi:hypothetical protein